MELYKRYRHPFAILMLDFDNLKWVNDTFGHAAGDTALTHLATVMRMNIRDVDIPCRFGGDEFLILMPEADKNAIQMVGPQDRRVDQQDPVQAGPLVRQPAGELRRGRLP